MNEEARAAELIHKMLRKKLYVLISKPLVPPEQLKPLLATHLDYMIGLESAGSCSPPVRLPKPTRRRAAKA